MSHEKLSFSEISHPPQFESMADLLEASRAMPHGEPETYGATPLDHPAAYHQQQEILAQLLVLVDTDVPDGIPEDDIEYAKNTFTSRFHNRGSANQENYNTSLRKKEEFLDDDDLQVTISRAELGHASPAELLIVRQVLGIRSAELACLTHPYGKRMDMLGVMRQAVKDNVEMLGGEYYEQPEKTHYRVKGLVGYLDCTKGLLMTRKRILGVMPDGTIIKERSSFILRTDDPAIIPADVLAKIEAIDRNTDEWGDKMVSVGGLDEIADQLLNDDEFTLAIPVSSTIYAFNEETTRLIEEREAREREVRRQAFEEDLAHNYPSLAEAMKQARLERKHEEELANARDVQGMWFVNGTGSHDQE